MSGSSSPPITASLDTDNICAGYSGNLNLSVSGGSGGFLEWFSGGCETFPIGTGNPLSIVSPGHSAIFYASWETTGCAGTTCVSAELTTTPSPVAPSSLYSDNNNYCSDMGGLTTLSSTGGLETTCQWSSVSCGGNVSWSGESYVLSAPVSTTTFYNWWEKPGCNNSSCDSITIIVYPVPVISDSSQADRNIICSNDGGTVFLSAYGGNGMICFWFTAGCGINLLGTGTMLQINSPLITTEYWTNWQSTTCTSSPCLSITLTVDQIPVPPSSATVDRNNYCPNDTGSITLSESGGSGTLVMWYTGSCGGSMVGVGNPLIISSPTLTTTYWVNFQTPGCSNTVCISVTTIVLPPATISGSMTGSVNVCSGGTAIYSVVYSAGLTYTWVAPPGWTGTGSINSISYIIGNASGNISVTPSDNCGAGVVLSKICEREYSICSGWLCQYCSCGNLPGKFCNIELKYRF